MVADRGAADHHHHVGATIEGKPDVPAQHAEIVGGDAEINRNAPGFGDQGASATEDDATIW